MMRGKFAQYLGMLLLALAPLFILVLIGCSPSSNFAGRERKQAPRDKADVGVLVQKASRQDVQGILNLYPQATVRVLNPEHGMYEIFGVKAADVPLPAVPNVFVSRL